jgi:hypothetical protein
MTVPIGQIVGTLGNMTAASSNKQAEANKAYNDYLLSEGQKAGARNALDGYGYTSYTSPYQSFFDQYISQYLGGDLTDGQKAQLETAGKEANANINTTMANRGGTIGGQLAMQQKTNKDLANQRLALLDSNADKGLNLAQTRDNFNMQNWLKEQESQMRYKELMAQYAPNEAEVDKPKLTAYDWVINPGENFGNLF